MTKFGLKREHLESINNCFAEYPAIMQVIVYGSRAKGNFKRSSDIDLVIIENDLSSSDLGQLESELDDLLLPYKIDLSLKRQITNQELRRHIERVGKLFYQKESMPVIHEPRRHYKKSKDN